MRCLLGYLLFMTMTKTNCLIIFKIKNFPSLMNLALTWKILWENFYTEIPRRDWVFMELQKLRAILGSAIWIGKRCWIKKSFLLSQVAKTLNSLTLQKNLSFSTVLPKDERSTVGISLIPIFSNHNYIPKKICSMRMYRII